MVGGEGRKEDNIVKSVVCHVVTSAMEDMVPARGHESQGTGCSFKQSGRSGLTEEPLGQPSEGCSEQAGTWGREFPLQVQGPIVVGIIQLPVTYQHNGSGLAH